MIDLSTAGWSALSGACSRHHRFFMDIIPVSCTMKRAAAKGQLAIVSSYDIFNNCRTPFRFSPAQALLWDVSTLYPLNVHLYGRFS
jgi:hypothetical protein